jgi:hypothetical protein
VSIARNVKRTLTLFSVEVACFALGYVAYTLWKEGSMTGSTLSDALLLFSLSMLIVLDYAIVGRHPPDETNATSESTGASGSTKREQVLKYLKVLGSVSSGQLASLLEIDVRNLSKFVNPLIQTGIIAARKEDKTFI